MFHGRLAPDRKGRWAGREEKWLLRAERRSLPWLNYIYRELRIWAKGQNQTLDLVSLQAMLAFGTKIMGILPKKSIKISPERYTMQTED